MTDDDPVVLDPDPEVQRRLRLRIIARMSLPVVVLAIIIAFAFDVFVAGIYAVLGIGITWFLVRRQMAKAPARLELGSSGVRYVEGSFTLEAPWDAVERIGPLPRSVGPGEGLLLARGALVEARSAKIEQFATGNGLDTAVPFTEFEPGWAGGRIGAALDRFAPHLTEGRTG